MRVCTADSSSTRRNTAAYSSQQQITVLASKYKDLTYFIYNLAIFEPEKKSKFLLNKVFFLVNLKNVKTHLTNS